MLHQGTLGIGHELRRLFRRNKQVGHTADQFAFGFELNNSTCPSKLLDQVIEILHVRAANDRLSCQDGFNRILAANSSKALPHSNDCSRAVPVPQFASRIDNQRRRGGTKPRLGSESVVNIRIPEQAFYFRRSLRVPRGQNQEKAGKLYSQLQVAIDKQLLLARVQASAQEDEALKIEAARAQPVREVDALCSFCLSGVIFNAPGSKNPIAAHSQ